MLQRAFPLSPPPKAPGDRRSLRWKLLIAASLLAAAVGTVACYAAAYYFLSPTAPPSVVVPLALLAPLATITFASIFVYRHTPRRRALQAVLTALIASLLAFAGLAAWPLLAGGR
jgi:drug/metabolite transporter (DMT)-like permease